MNSGLTNTIVSSTVVLDTTYLLNSLLENLVWSVKKDGKNCNVLYEGFTSLLYDTYDKCAYLFDSYSSIYRWTHSDSMLKASNRIPLPPGPGSMTSMAFSPSAIFAATYYYIGANGGIGGYSQIFANTKGDTTWTDLGFQGEMSSFVVRGDDVLVKDTHNRLFYKNGLKGNWSAIPVDAPLEVFSIFASDSQFYFGTNNGLFICKSPNDTWKELGLSGKVINRMYVDKQSIAVSFDATGLGLNQNGSSNWSIINLPLSNMEIGETMQISNYCLYITIRDKNNKADTQQGVYYTDIRNLGINHFKFKAEQNFQYWSLKPGQNSLVLTFNNVHHNSHLRIFDMRGRCIIQRTITSNTSNITIPKLVGQYLLELNLNGTIFSKKFIALR